MRQNHANIENELTVNEIEQISRHYRKLTQLTLTGGEPFLRNDLHLISQLFYENSGMRWLTIPTNGYLTGSIIETTQKILDQSPDLSINIDLSIDACDSYHDSIRRLPGSFQQAMQTFNELKKIRDINHRLSIKWTTVVSPFNESHVSGILNRLASLGADDHELLLARGQFRDKYDRNVSMETYKRLIHQKRLLESKYHKKLKGFARLFHILYEHLYDIMIKSQTTNKMIYPCLAGQKFIEIYENGQVVPCEMRQWIQKDGTQGFGSLRHVNYNISELLQTSRAKHIIKKIKHNYCDCTFECAILCNMIFSFSAYPHLLYLILLDEVSVRKA
jgi:sulfatase maturation enzyme AslB (radical SAM superfamily)